METNASKSTQNSEKSTCASNHEGPNIRKKTNVAWRYCSELTSDARTKVLICCFCDKHISGGGINRVKQHLAHVKGVVELCPKVPVDLKYLVECALKENIRKAKEKKGLITIEVDTDGNSSVPISTNKDSNTESAKGKRKASKIRSFFKAGKLDSIQPSIKACIQSKEMWHDTNMAIALYFYDACIPFNAVNSPFFQAAAEKMANIGHGYKVSTFHALRVTLLRDAKTQVKLIVDSFREHWAEFECTIMRDGWTGTRQRPLINFLVYCTKGISFIKLVDASNIVTNAENLCNLFSEIVELVGSDNVAHMVTDNGANYKAAGRLLS
ncbi:hAT transposon superfamily [Euphorbia peplus]|nr:hAT transposon superfamily [Euphorbia peplus]